MLWEHQAERARFTGGGEGFPGRSPTRGGNKSALAFDAVFGYLDCHEFFSVGYPGS